MHQYVLHLWDGKSYAVLAGSLEEACRYAGLTWDQLTFLKAFEKNGRFVAVAVQSNCECHAHAAQGLACPHDLDRVGLSSPLTQIANA